MPIQYVDWHTVRAVAAFVVGVAALFIPSAFSQSYPAKPVTAVVPMPPGTTVDILARTFAEQFHARTKQPLVIENRPGAGLMLAMQAVAGAPADGYLLAYSPASPLTVLPHRGRKLPYSAAGFVPLCQTFENEFVLVVSPLSPFKTLPQLLSHLKARPSNTWSFAHSGVAGTPHLTGAEFWSRVGVSALDIPYRGESAILADLLGGSVDSAVITLSMAKQAKVPVLAVFGSERSKAFPDVPTAKELGHPIAPAGFGGLFVKVGTPPDVIDKLQTVCRDVVSSAAYQAKATELLQLASYLDGRQFSKRIDDESKAKAKLLEQLKLPTD